MSDGTADVSRRTFLRSATGATAIAAASGGASAQETGTGGGTEGGGGGGGGPPDFGTWFSNVPYFDGSVTDATGQGEATVAVGGDANSGLSFQPVAIHVDSGTTVTWQWTGKGGGHNVVSEGDGPLDSGSPVADESATYEYTFEEDGIYKYYCDPHRTAGMKGAVVVGTDYPQVQTDPGASTPVNPEHMGVPFQAHFVGISTALAIFVSLVFTFFTLKYGESANTKGGNN